MRGSSTALMFFSAFHVALLSPMLAYAGQDAVFLRNDQVVHGEVVDSAADDGVHIKLESGDVETIPRSEIMRIEHHPDVVETDAIDQPPAPSEAQVHIEGPSAMRLEWDATGHHDWRVACFAPCEKSLARWVRYRLVGDGIRPSGDFRLSQVSDSRDVIMAKPASSTWFTVGAIALATGALAASFGIDVAFLQSVAFGGESTSPGATTDAWLAIGIGGAVATVGLLLMLDNLRTSVSQVRGAPQGRVGTSNPRVPWPAWRAARAETPLDLRAATFPLIYETF